jgi:hypothetical protein
MALKNSVLKNHLSYLDKYANKVFEIQILYNIRSIDLFCNGRAGNDNYYIANIIRQLLYNVVVYIFTKYISIMYWWNTHLRQFLLLLSKNNMTLCRVRDCTYTVFS